ncbi:elongator complex protein 3 [Candidatus Electronema sp. PJ]|uniref:elongator complex protein 3 n=1 Tax=Candidatus Electronema sp. PJ TaxID=3401572 RepID=UPI003AA822E4
MIIPIFIPHEGCPHRCLFCNQHRISGQVGKPVTAEAVQAEIQTWLERTPPHQKTQVAFYGGSFTALPRLRQKELLNAAAPFLESGQVQSLRLSTRPDCLDDEQAAFLKAHQVATVELGVQSMNEQVLALARRGHSVAAVEQAMLVLRQAKLEIGIQLLLGLPGDKRASLRHTVEQVILLRPDFVRIYPILVLRGSGLAELYEQGRYQPFSLDKAVLLAAFMKKRFAQAGIPVIRLGLQAGAELESSLLAGPWHPAFGELVSSRLMFRQTKKLLAQAKTNQVCLQINPRDQSVFRGIKAANIARLEQLGLWQRISLVTDPAQERGFIKMVAREECGSFTQEFGSVNKSCCRATTFSGLATKGSG